MPMKTNRSRLLLATVCLVMLSGCAALQGFFKKAFQKPRFTFKTARLSQASLSDATVDLVYQLENPNPLGLSLASVNYAFFVEDKQVVAGTPPTVWKALITVSAPASIPARKISAV